MSKEFFDAIRAGDAAKVAAMLKAEPGLVATKDENGQSAFVVAKYARRDNIAGMLDKGVEFDIFEACMAGDEERVVELVSSQHDLTKTYSSDGWTPLHLAAFYDHPAIIEALLSYGADVDARSR